MYGVLKFAAANECLDAKTLITGRTFLEGDWNVTEWTQHPYNETDFMTQTSSGLPDPQSCLHTVVIQTAKVT